MKHEIDLKNFEIRTDLINESLEKIKDKNGIDIKNYKNNNVEVEEVYINKEASKRTNIKEGNYISLLFDDVTDSINRKNIEEEFIKVFKHLLQKKNLSIDKSCLIIGLGNKDSTPDSLGPSIVDKILVTRYINSISEIDKGYRVTSAFAPGVFGTSGIETSDIVLKLTEIIKPDFLIVIDALKAMNVNRVNRTIQISDIGIAPGSGIGNKRKEISEKTIGIPVLAIGVPTITDASIIVSDTIKYLYKKLSYTEENIENPINKFKRDQDINYLQKESKELTKEEKTKILGLVGALEEEDVRKLIYEVLEPIGYNLMVTVKEIDFVIKELVEVISKALNGALHDKMIDI